VLIIFEQGNTPLNMIARVLAANPVDGIKREHSLSFISCTSIMFVPKYLRTE
jgi:hypothetical protein